MEIFRLFGTILIDSREAGSSIQNIGRRASEMSGAIGKFAIGVGVAVAGVAAGATKVGMSYEKAMSQVAATMGITADKGNADFKLLSDAAKKAGEETQFSASQAAEALNYLALAGYDAQKAAATLPAVLNLAAAGGLELGAAAELTTGAMNALGIEEENLAAFTDQMAVTAQKSGTNVSELGAGILMVAGTAKKLAGGTVELNTALGILADNAMKGSEGGIFLRNVMVSLGKAGKPLEELGISAYDSAGNLRTLQDIFADLRYSLKELTSEERDKELLKIFKATDLKAVEALLATTGERWDELGDHIKNSEGAAAQMAKTMNDNLAGVFTTIGSKLEGLAVDFYERFQEPLRKAFESVLKGLDFIADNFDAVMTVVIGLTTAFIAFAIAINISKMIDKVKTSFIVLNAVMAANPAVLLITVIAGLIAAILYLWHTNEDFKNAWIAMIFAINKVAMEFVDAIVSFFTETIPGAINELIGWFGRVGEGIGNKLNEVIDAVSQWVLDMVDAIATEVPKIIDSIVSFFSELPYKIGYAIGFTVGTLIKWGIDLVKTIAIEVPKIVESVITFFKGLPQRIYDAIIQTKDRLIDWGKNLVATAKKEVSKIIDAIVNYFEELPKKNKVVLDNTIADFKTWGNNLIESAKKFIPDLIEKIVIFFKELPAKLLEIGKNMIDGLWEGIQSKAKELMDNITSFFKGIVDGIKDTLGIHSPSKVFADMGKNTGQGFIDGISGMNGAVSKAMDNVFGGLADNIDINANLHPINGANIVGDNISNDGSLAAKQSGGDTFILHVDVSKIDDLNKLKQVFEDFKHSKIAYGGT